jgi:hypothetical protein
MKHSHETRWLARELKFLVTPECASQLKAWARQHLEADPFASPEMGDAYLTASLYFDTPRFDVFRENGSYGRAKYRVRRYGRDDMVFLERKLKNHQMVVKRRSIVSIADLARLKAGNETDLDWEGGWFHRRIAMRGLTPVCQVAYQRTARIANTGAGLIRLTIDQDLRAIPAGAPAFDHDKAGVNLLEDALIVEMKFREAMPDLFAKVIEEFGLEPAAISKYKLAVRHLALVDEPALEQQAIQAVA